MTPLHGVVKEFKELTDRLRQEETRLNNELEEVTRKRTAVEAAVDVYIEWQTSEDRSEPAIDPLVVLIKNCKTQKEALYEIARMQGGMINVTKAGKLMRASGLTRSGGKPRSVVSTLYRMVSEGEDWEYVGPGTFRLRETVAQAFAESESSTHPNGSAPIPTT